jgi:hypothetical protein
MAFFVEGPNPSPISRAKLLALRLWYPFYPLKFKWIIMKDKLKNNYLVWVGWKVRGQKF